jgi:alkanesulfonate monooxygenase SsuD/methylene tetrahydromethanopterin reductase-like flavin-dependent oxidoreductase (luciferase family)
VWVAPFGHERPHAKDAVRECVDVVRALWRGERVTFDGKVVHVHDVVLDCPLPPAIPVLIAARGPRMLALAGEIADIVHLASLFLGSDSRSDDLARVAAGARSAQRAPGSYEIDISVTVSASHDRAAARRAALRNAAQSILWYAGADRYAKQREWNVPRGFAVPRSTVDALAAGWDMWRDPELPPELGALITDDLLDDFTVWGEPAECARRLAALAAMLPARQASVSSCRSRCGRRRSRSTSPMSTPSPRSSARTAASDSASSSADATQSHQAAPALRPTGLRHVHGPRQHAGC